MDPLLGHTLGQYEILSEIGRGGMGAVYKARHQILNRFFAIKVLAPHLVFDQQFVARFRQEARATSSIPHAHIVQVHDIGEEGNLHYIVMDFIDGETLSQRLNDNHQFTLDEVIAIARQIGSALDYAHGHGIVHRDVKPSNILLDKPGDAFLTDFGIAKAMAGTRVTRTGTSIGTPEYMSPEQAQGDAVDGRSDLYSLAVVLYEMLTGMNPFRADTPVASAYRTVHTPASPIRSLRTDLPAHVEQSMATALAKNPAHRFAAAADFVSALEGKGAATVAGAPPDGATLAVPSVAVLRKPQRCWRPIALAAALCMALITSITAFATSDQWRAFFSPPTAIEMTPRPTPTVFTAVIPSPPNIGPGITLSATNSASEFEIRGGSDGALWGKVLLTQTKSRWIWLRAESAPLSRFRVAEAGSNDWQSMDTLAQWGPVSPKANAALDKPLQLLDYVLSPKLFTPDEDRTSGILRLKATGNGDFIGDVIVSDGRYYFFVPTPVIAPNGATTWIRLYAGELSDKYPMTALIPPTPTVTRPPTPTRTTTPRPPTATVTSAPPTNTFTPRPPTATFTPEPPTPTPLITDPNVLIFLPRPPRRAFRSTLLSTIQGKVVDLRGKGIPGIKVEIEGGAFPPTRTDGNGDYFFSDLKNGKYNIRLIDLPKATPASNMDLDVNSTLFIDFFAVDESYFFTPTPTLPATPTREGGINSQAVLDVAVDPNNNQVVFALVRDKGIYKTTNGGAFWTPNFTAPAARSIKIDPTNPQIVYVTTWNSVLKTADGGGSWAAYGQGRGLPLNQIVNTLVMDPNNSQVLYVGTDGGAFKSTDGGVSWSDISRQFTAGKVYGLAGEPSNGGVLYAALQATKLFKTTNAGGTWEELSYNFGNVFYAVAVDPSNPQVVYAGLNVDAARVIKSTNAGQTWEGRSMGLANKLIIGKLVIDPSNPQRIYAGTGYLSNAQANGVYRSTNGSASWESWSNGLPRAPETGAFVYVQSIVLDPNNPSVLFAATGGGLYKSSNGGANWVQQ